MEMIPIIMVFIAVITLVMSIWKIHNFKTNCIATLTAKVINIDKEIGNIRENQSKIFDKLDVLTDRVSKIEGRLNGIKQ